MDANVFMYAAGSDPVRREACRAALAGLTGRGGAPAATSAEVLQEILHRYRAIGRLAQGLEVFDAVVDLGLHVLPVDLAAMQAARVMLESHPGLASRDAVHAATMRQAGLERLLSYDRGFDALDWLTRTEP